MTLTVRLDPRTERALRALAKRRKQSQSDVVREALASYTAANDGEGGERQPYDQWADVIGIIRSGARDPERTTGDLFAEVVTRKRRARRSR